MCLFFLLFEIGSFHFPLLQMLREGFKECSALSVPSSQVICQQQPSSARPTASQTDTDTHCQQTNTDIVTKVVLPALA